VPGPAQPPPAQDDQDEDQPLTDPGTDSADLDSDDLDRGRSVDTEPDNARIVVVGPAAARARDFVTFTLAAENVKGLSHAPIRLAWDADVLEFVSAEEGGFLKSDGATTQFMVAPGETPGTLDIALSRRTGAAGGVDGSGVLVTLTFLARAPGMSPIVTTGSRFLDASARGMNLRSDDAYVSVQ
jgi:general secretion pathway protein D